MDNQSDVAAKASQNRKVTYAVLLIISPIILGIVGLMFAAITNFAFSATGATDENILRRIVNIIVFLIGGIASVMIIVGPILGIIRLVNALKK